MSKFQIVLLGLFGFFLLLGVLVFAYGRKGSSAEGRVVIWGDIPSEDWASMANAQNFANNDLEIQYVEKESTSLTSDFTEALAEGRGPDLIILPLDKLWTQRNRLIPVPYSSIGERDFKSTFVEEGELFLTPSGMYALPLTIDPLVLYYNRDMLSSAGVASPIRYWDEIYTAAETLTERDLAGNVTKSVMALGEANNIPNYKDVLALLMLQAGTPITAQVASADEVELRSLLNSKFDLPIVPTEAALDFYTQFSNPSKSFYSWNRSLLPADTHFVSGDSAYYVGYASEFRILRVKSPTLNIGVAPVPQSRTSGRATTLGDMRGIAIARGTKNPTTALAAAIALISKENVSELSGIMMLPPVRRDLLAERQGDAVLSVFYESALQSRGWLDPDTQRTAIVFREMIESVTSGRARTSEAVSRAHREFGDIINER